MTAAAVTRSSIARSITADHHPTAFSTLVCWRVLRATAHPASAAGCLSAARPSRASQSWAPPRSARTACLALGRRRPDMPAAGLQLRAPRSAPHTRGTRSHRSARTEDKRTLRVSYQVGSPRRSSGPGSGTRAGSGLGPSGYDERRCLRSDGIRRSSYENGARPRRPSLPGCSR
jgi:hypothetical protein